LFPTSNGSPVTTKVYGGPLIIGATNGVAPYTGITQNLVAHAPGSSALQLSALAATQASAQTTDLFDWAFVTQPSLFVTQVPALVAYYSAYSQNSTVNLSALQFSIPTVYSATNSAISLNSWNPWGLPFSSFNLCDSLADCQSVKATTALNILQLFNDPGKDLAWFNWAGTGAANDATTGVTQVSPAGYSISYSGGQQFSITTAKPAVFGNDQYITLQFATSLPATTVVTVTMVDSNGATYTSNTTVDQDNIGSYAALQMPNIVSQINSKAITITIALPASAANAGTVILSNINGTLY
jgi:hypothetical protein